MKRTVLTINRCLVISALFAIVFTTSTYAENKPIVAKAIVVEGAVTVFLVGEKFGRRVTVGSSFADGDRIVTGKDSSVVIEFVTGSRIRVDQSSEMILRVNL